MCETTSNLTTILIEACIASLFTIFASAFFKYYARSRRYRGDVISYKCATQMSHSFGKMVTDPNSNSGDVWEHNNEGVLETSGDCTVYGPYKNDSFEPGRYTVTFRVLIDGAKEEHLEILKMEALRWSGNDETPIREIALTGKDVFMYNGKYHDYSFECYVGNSSGRWEYRAFVNRPLWANNGLTIKFDTITMTHNSTFLDGFLG